jgi:hypothetical protein
MHAVVKYGSEVCMVECTLKKYLNNTFDMSYCVNVFEGEVKRGAFA